MRAEALAQAENERLEEERDEAVQATRFGWAALLANDSDAVLEALEAAFADNEAPAAAVNCVGAEVVAVMMAPALDLIPDQTPALTPTGKPTLKRRTQRERNDLYVAHIASNVLATAKEALAAAPALEAVTILVVRREQAAGLLADRAAALFCGTFPRRLLETARWDRMDLTRVLDEVPEGLFVRKGRSGDVQPLDLGKEPEIAQVLAQVNAGLRAAPEDQSPARGSE